MTDMMDTAAILAELADYAAEHNVVIDADAPVPPDRSAALTRGVFEGALWALSMATGTSIDELRLRIARMSTGPEIPLPGRHLTAVDPNAAAETLGVGVPGPDAQPLVLNGQPAADPRTDPNRKIWHADSMGNELVVTRDADVNRVDPATPRAEPGWRPHADVQPMTPEESAALDAMPEDPNAAAQIAAAKAQLDATKR